MSTNEVFYHFTGDTLRDGTSIPPIGEWLIFKGTPTLCLYGLHASRHPLDALRYAPGKRLHKVELGGFIKESSDKVVATHRKIIASIDAEELLWRAARKFALDVIHFWNPPKIVIDYLETGNSDIRDAARDAMLVLERPFSLRVQAGASTAWCALSRLPSTAAQLAAADAGGHFRTPSCAACAKSAEGYRVDVYSHAMHCRRFIPYYETQKRWFALEVEKEFAKYDLS